MAPKVKVGFKNSKKKNSSNITKVDSQTPKKFLVLIKVQR